MSEYTNLFAKIQQEAELDMDLTDLVPFGTEGSGNQIKYWKDNRLIKLNSKYHEAQKEVSCSKLAIAFGIDAVRYTANKYTIDNKTFWGCESVSYLQDNEESVSFASLISMKNFAVPMKMSATDYFLKMTEVISETTKIDADSVANYILTILVFDYIVCNPDRHLSNLEMIHNSSTNAYRFAPLFDLGQAFLKLDAMPSQDQLQMLLHKFKTRPFSSNPEKNIINKDLAKQIATKFIESAGGFNALKSLDINEVHRYLAIKRLHKLLEV